MASHDDWYETYISFDLETDGPVPGHYSILSIGMSVAGRQRAGRYTASPATQETFYATLKPTTGNFNAEAMAVNGLDRALLARSGLDPAEALERLTQWLAVVSAGTRPVLVAYPATFDWPFLAYYYRTYLDCDPPVPFTRVCDLRTLIVAAAHRQYYTPTAECLPAGLYPSRVHTHHALQDAIDQAELFSAVQLWRQRSAADPPSAEC
jgi:DNA polymerase III epsilon subunit-like protein